MKASDETSHTGALLYALAKPAEGLLQQQMLLWQT